MNKISAGEKTCHMPTDHMSLLEQLQPWTQIAALRTEMNLPIILEAPVALELPTASLHHLQMAVLFLFP